MHMQLKRLQNLWRKPQDQSLNIFACLRSECLLQVFLIGPKVNWASLDLQLRFLQWLLMESVLKIALESRRLQGIMLAFSKCLTSM